MSDQSHRDAMNAAIRSQRERGNVPRSMLPPEDEPRPIPAAPEPAASEPRPIPAAPEPMAPQLDTQPDPEPETAVKKGFLSRLFGR